MATQGIIMESISVSRAKDDLNNIINRVAYNDERFFITKFGEKMVAIVSLKDLESIVEKEKEVT
jgi:prevent-host-death family protein